MASRALAKTRKPLKGPPLGVATLKVINGLSTAPDGTFRSGIVRAVLSQPVTITANQEVVPQNVEARMKPDGTWTLNLYANSDLSPGGTYYTITEAFDSGASYQYTVIVPGTAGPFNAASIQTGVPPTASPTPGHLSSLIVDGSSVLTGPVTLGTTILTAPSPNGTDDTAALNAFFAAAPAGAWCLLQAGIYKVPSGNLNITKQLKITGTGGLKNTSLAAGTQIQCASPTASLFVVTADGCTFESMLLINTYSGTPTAGAGILFTAGNKARLVEVDVMSFWDNIHIDNGWWWKATDCFFSDAANDNFFCRNLAYVDDGDAVIHGCDFLFLMTARAARSHIRQEGGGGLRITACKFNGNAKPNGAYPGSGNVDVAIDCNMPTGAQTGDLMINGCSIEVARSHLIRVTATGTGAFQLVTITGNQLAIAPNGVWVGGASGYSVNDVNITGNVFKYISNFGVYAQWAGGVTVGPNEWSAFSGTCLIQMGVIATAAGGVGGRVAQQNVIGDSIRIYENPLAIDPNVHPTGAQARNDFEREIPVCNSTSVYVTLFRLSFSNFSAGLLDIVFAGQINGKGAAMIATKATYNRGNGGNVTVTTIGADITSGFVFDYLLDTTTVAGEVQVKVRLNAAVGGTDLVGVCRASVDGPIVSCRKGA